MTKQIFLRNEIQNLFIFSFYCLHRYLTHEQQKDVSMISVNKYQALKYTTELFIICSRRDSVLKQKNYTLLPVSLLNSHWHIQPIVPLLK